MPQLLVAAAGSAIGASIGGTFLGVSAAGWGWMVGSLVGAKLFGPNPPDGPRITDGDFSNSVYGQPIPISYGTIRHKTQPIWFSGLHEASHRVGRSKFSSGARVYTYSCDLMVSVCEGPMAAVLRIWANGRLIWSYDGDAGIADEEIISASNVRVYLGTEDQTPDPLYEADVGTENAVAYRGQVVVMLEGMQLAFAGDRPPVIECEVTSEVTVEEATLVRTEIVQYEGDDSTDREGMNLVATDNWWIVNGPSNAGVLFINRDTLAQYEIEGAGGPSHNILVIGNYAFTALPNLSIGRYDLRTEPPEFVQVGTGYLTTMHVATDGTDLYTYRFGYAAIRRYEPASMALKFELTLATSPDCFTVIGNPPVVWYGKTKTLYRTELETGTHTSYVLPISGNFGNAQKLEYDASRNSLLFRTTADDELVEFDIEAGEVAQIITGVGAVVGNHGGSMAYDSASGLWVAADGAKIWWIDVAAGEVVDEWDAVMGVYGILDTGLVPDGDNGVYVSETDESGNPTWLVHYRKGGGSAIGGPITLREIVEDVCERAGLPAENLDATAGTDLVDGYKIATQSTARAAIEALRPAYFFDMPESGSKIVLKKRGGAVAATIDSGELGAHVWQVTQDEPTPPYEMEHAQEIEAPRVLEVVYLDASMDYDQNVQQASRQVGASRAPMRIDVPVVMDTDKALSVAWTNLLMAHAAKQTLKLQLTHAYAALDPADPIVVPLADGEARRVRIERIVRARPLMELEAVVEDAAEIYDQDLVGGGTGAGPTQGETPVGLSGTVLAIMDLPPLRAEDDVLGAYLALSKAVRAESWPGGGAYKSVDGGANYDGVYETAAPATVGVTTTALQAWAGGNRWDDDNAITVELSSGTLSGATDLGVLAGMNAIAVQSGTDWEIVQFVNAEVVATNTWRLTRLLRGRIGTERAIAGHAIGDRVVLLTTGSLYLLGYPLGEIGLVRDFIAVTSGQAMADGAEQTFTAAANSLRPLSPVSIEGTRDAGDLTITWIRRARINAEWLDLYDVPLDEPAESYEIDILDGATVVRTLTASTPTVEYTAAQQTTDFGSPQAEIDVAIYQMSSRVGRGHAGEATL